MTCLKPITCEILYENFTMKIAQKNTYEDVCVQQLGALKTGFEISPVCFLANHKYLCFHLLLPAETKQLRARQSDMQDFLATRYPSPLKSILIKGPLSTWLDSECMTDNISSERSVQVNLLFL